MYLLNFGSINIILPGVWALSSQHSTSGTRNNKKVSSSSSDLRKLHRDNNTKVLNIHVTKEIRSSSASRKYREFVLFLNK